MTAPSLVGSSLGNWRLDELIGEGRSGTVYKAHETAAPFRTAAVKVRQGLAVKASHGEFVREADMLERQPIPGFMPALFDRGTSSDPDWYAMEFADSLPRKLPRKSVPVIFGRLAEALSRLHAAGYLHCDVKREHIGRIRGKAVLLDFGSVLSADAAARHPLRTGTWQYMAPEVREGRLLDARADIYSLGIVLSEVCRGQGNSIYEHLVLRTTANDPNARLQSADEFRRLLLVSEDAFRKTAAAKRIGWAIAATIAIFSTVALTHYVCLRASVGRKFSTTILTNVQDRVLHELQRR